MAHKFNFEITNEVQLNQDGLTVLEIKNDVEGTYDYYVYLPNYPMAHSFGVLQNNPNSKRFSSVELVRLYENGYFDSIIEEEFI